MNKKSSYNTVHFEIVGFCNAKCPWCYRGRKHLIQASKPPKYIELNDFQNAITTLLNKGLICPGESVINLYQWGEPMLHPRLNEILQVLSRKNINFRISTNSSKFVPLDKDVLCNLQEIRFSMPGFSQLSYDRIHGFKFETILNNIEMFCKDIQAGGPSTRLTMNYHLYQFNIGEIRDAMKFCIGNGIDFVPYFAFLNDFELEKAYLDKSINKEILGELSKDLFLYYIDNMIASIPQDFICPQFEILTIDEDCNVLTCCIFPQDHPEYSLGKLATLSCEDIQKGKLSRKLCIECAKMGISYWNHNNQIPSFINDYIATTYKDIEINALLNSKSFKLGRTLTLPIRYILHQFKGY